MFFGVALILCLNLLSATEFPSAKTSFTTVNLAQAVEKSLSQSPVLLASKNALQVADLELKNIFSNFLPSVDMSASHGFKKTDPEVFTASSKIPNVSRATVTLSENLYDNGETYKKYQIAKLKQQIAKLNYQKNKAQIVKSVTLAYYRYVLATQNLIYITRNHQELERLSRLLMNQFQQGIKTKKDYLGFKTRAQRGRLDVLSAERQVAGSRHALLVEMGLSPDEKIQFDETVKLILPKDALTVDIGPEDLYEFQLKTLDNQVSQLQVDLQKRVLWPEISLVAAASYGSSDYINTQTSWNDNDASEWSVLLNLKFNLIDWGVRSRNIQIAKLNQHSLDQANLNNVLSAQNELEEFKTEVKHSQEHYQIAKELQKLEEDSFKMLERDYRSGQTTYLELVTGLANLLDAQSRGQNADYKQAELYLKWKYYKGILSEETFSQ